MVSLDTASFAGGDIAVTFLRQVGSDPFAASAERSAQIKAVATRMADFIAAARASLDIAIYDFRLHDEPAAIVAGALRDRAKAGVAIRIAYDAAAETDRPAPDDPAHVEADKKVAGTEPFVASLADTAKTRAITGFRVLMHNKYIIRDGAAAEACVLMGSSNFTNDSWGLQENNILELRSAALARYYAADFSELWSRGKIIDKTGAHDGGPAQIGDASVELAFTPGGSATAVKEIVGMITGARQRLAVASVVISSGPILAALSEAIDRGLKLSGLYDGPQMDQVVRQWQSTPVGADKTNTWEKVAQFLVRKDSIPYDAAQPHQPHNFMHNKLVVSDELVCTGSFNLSNHAMGNAENVLVIRHKDLADRYAQYIGELIQAYRAL
jgi:phosphatidylserine/phosphatidylglycerophosphate/cardiolipin synthase-like enzyme